MGYQTVFKRYEIKYLVTAEQKARILKAMEPFMEMDKFGRSTVRNIYFDTDDFVLARHSIAKPDFKEKLRIRSYSRADSDSTVFVELKRKFDGVVYKRRVGLREADAMSWMTGAQDRAGECGQIDAADPAVFKRLSAGSSQVINEIEYFKGLYRGLKPVLYLSYDREAYRMKSGANISDGGAEFRVTFDCNIRCREHDLTLRSEAYGTDMLDHGMFLMELKCPGAIPLWMTEVLSREHIYKTSFSKYGNAYCSFMSATPEERAHMIAVSALERTTGSESAEQREQQERQTQLEQQRKRFGIQRGSRQKYRHSTTFGRISV